MYVLIDRFTTVIYDIISASERQEERYENSPIGHRFNYNIVLKSKKTLFFK